MAKRLAYVAMLMGLLQCAAVSRAAASTGGIVTDTVPPAKSATPQEPAKKEDAVIKEVPKSRKQEKPIAVTPITVKPVVVKPIVVKPVIRIH